MLEIMLEIITSKLATEVGTCGKENIIDIKHNGDVHREAYFCAYYQAKTPFDPAKPPSSVLRLAFLGTQH